MKEQCGEHTGMWKLQGSSCSNSAQMTSEQRRRFISSGSVSSLKELRIRTDVALKTVVVVVVFLQLKHVRQACTVTDVWLQRQFWQDEGFLKQTFLSQEPRAVFSFRTFCGRENCCVCSRGNLGDVDF